MRNSRLHNVITVVLTGLSISFMFLCGCAAVPTVRISDVDRDTVVDALRKTSGYPLVGRDTIERRRRTGKWLPSDFAKFSNRNSVSKKHTRSYDCGFRVLHTRDRITVKSEKSGSTLVSVKCEKKGRGVLNLVKLVSPFYERNSEKEANIIAGLLRNLKGAGYEWVGEWRP